ncbi:MAG: single-stranded-DNA-specific exonuclease RecJ [Bacteroidia bacterium]|nr:single-stranded-DNA-specific exonuclease RecJ [Bacteroidia bacterium]
MKINWVLKEKGDKKLIQELATALNVNERIAGLLVDRGITNFEKAKEFFRPELNMLHDSFLMKGMEKAIVRIEEAIEKKESVLIYGDYDVDGTTSVALVYSFFKNVFSKIDYYIPDRYKEGYGISTAGIDWAADNNYSLVIALDCGIKSVDKINYAKNKNVDFIICDHHLPGDVIPNAVAVLDPKQNNCNYPFKELSGCGIGFKLVQAFAAKNAIDFNELKPLLDFVVISIAADIVPIIGENRVLAYYGLEQINNEELRPGIKSLVEVSGKKLPLTISDVVFGLAPRINAAGRIESGKQAVALLISDSVQEASAHGSGVNINNTTRRELDQNITEHAISMIENDEVLQKRKSTVVFDKDWHKGVVGIVASRLIEKFYKPTIVLTEAGGKIVGSARSVKGFSVYNAIEKCSTYLDQFGGHKYAAGLTIKEGKLDEFIEAFEKEVASTILPEQTIPCIEIDSEIDLEEIDSKFRRIIQQFEPFGPGNLSPVFKTSSVKDSGRSRVVGKDHLKLSLTHRGNSMAIYDGIAFQMGKVFENISSKPEFDIAYSIEENHFNGRTSLQLKIKDIKFD